MSENYSRIIYSPEVKVYILPGANTINSTPNPIDISEDIIEGSIHRTTEGVSTASFLLQSRKLKDNSSLLGSIIRPMDRIVVYLKKVKPILVFSGYLDLVPLFQAVPEPFTIEASCTLKRLEFTYWDPQLPHVYETLAKYGFVPSANGQGGMDFFVPVGTRAGGSGNKAASGEIQDTGFGAMLYFLIHQVGGWADDSIWIEPLPEQWMQRAYYLFQESNDWNERYNSAQSFLKSFLTSGGTSGGGGSDGSADAVILNGNSIAGKIDAAIKKYGKGNTDVTAQDFIDAGQKYNVDPRFICAVACYETACGTTGQGRLPADGGYCNMFGLGNHGVPFPTRAESIFAAARQLGSKDKDYYLGKNPSQTIDGWIVNWNLNSQSELAGVKSIWKAMETGDAKVDFSKPYSIRGQGIGDVPTNGGTGPASRSTTNPAPSDASTSSNSTISVYIEAGHSGQSEGMMQPGYQKQTGSGDGKEVNDNRDVLDVINRLYEALPAEDQSRLDITFSKFSSRPAGQISDVYISIHHDPKLTNGVGYVGAPCQHSVRGKDASIGAHNADIPGLPDQQGKPGPNYYQPDGGSGWKMPSDLGEGRDRIDNDDNLIKNSSFLVQQIVKQCTAVTDKPFVSTTGTNNQKYNRMNNYYGFYYSNAAACSIIEAPEPSDASVTKVAKGILNALFAYQSEWKAKGKQKDPVAGATSGGQTTQSSTGDGSKASQLIQICKKAADANKEYRSSHGGKSKMTYSMKVRHPGVKLSECIQKGYSMDCSSFISNGLREFGFPQPSGGDITTHFWSSSEKIAVDNDSEGKRSKYEPGMFFIKGKDTGGGGDGHIVLITSVDGECVHCTSEPSHEEGGPSYTTVDSYITSKHYDLCKYTPVGSTTDPGSGGGGSGGASGIDPFLIAKSTAFNVAFNFPGSMLDSVLLTGERALENDVKLLDTIQEVCKASQRTFSSLPNGDFIAWYPDYFNLTGENAWLRISPTEIKSCTISLNDKNLVTHLYILGNPFGFNTSSGSNINLEWYEKLMGSGVVTLERPWLLDSFLRPFEPDSQEDPSNQTNTQESISSKKSKTVSRPRSVLEAQGGRLLFLERYGARPHMEKIPTIRHPILEFFYAYHTFIQKWAEQFISKAEFTFMPELFPGMIIELDMKHGTGDDFDKEPIKITFYVKDVTHTFSYESGFSTSAILMAPGTTSKQNDWSMVLVNPPNAQGEYKKNKTIKISDPKKTGRNARATARARRAAAARRAARSNNPRAAVRTVTLAPADTTISAVALTDGEI
jgi:hypothetical protein